MQRISLVNVPFWVKNSQLCRNLKNKDNVSIPKKYYIVNLTIQTDEEYVSVLETMEYWNIDQVPHRVYEYAKYYYRGCFEEIFDIEKLKDFKFKKELILLNKHGMDYDGLITIYQRDDCDGGDCDKYTTKFKTDVVKGGFLNLLKYIETTDGIKCNGICNYAIQGNNIPMLKYLLSLGNIIDSYSYEFAVASGNLDILKIIYNKDNSIGHYLKWNYLTYESAIINGKLECLKFLVTYNCPRSGYGCSTAARNKQLACLKYLNDAKIDNYTDKNLTAYAAMGGCLKCLKYVHDKIVSSKIFKYDYLDPRKTNVSCNNASMHGHLECLKYLKNNGYLMNNTVCSNAAQHGHLDCLKYALDCGCKWDINIKSNLFDFLGELLRNKDSNKLVIK